ncbi:MAG TPA: hypothetical protein VF669_18400, partial [Tepidisphaeraceae bacterium]
MAGNSYRLAVHGLAVELACEVAGLRPALDHYLGEFAVPDWPDGFARVRGTIRDFDQREVMKCLSPTARRIEGPDFLELYEENERFWAIDERWGMCEINLIKGMWRSWILPATAVDSIQCTHAAAMWPMAQLLRGRGLHLLPAEGAEVNVRAHCIAPGAVETQMLRGIVSKEDYGEDKTLPPEAIARVIGQC